MAISVLSILYSDTERLKAADITLKGQTVCEKMDFRKMCAKLGKKYLELDGNHALTDSNHTIATNIRLLEDEVQRDFNITSHEVMEWLNIKRIS